jgi:hypothetical protein
MGIPDKHILIDFAVALRCKWLLGDSVSNFVELARVDPLSRTRRAIYSTYFIDRLILGNINRKWYGELLGVVDR